jgi:mitochondrial chaperone BCS1
MFKILLSTFALKTQFHLVSFTMSSAPTSSSIVASPNNLPKDPFQTLRSSYDLALYLIKDILGFDPVIVVNLSIFLAAVSAFGRYVTNSLYGYARNLFMSSVHINDDDALYQYVVRWMSDRHIGSKALRSVKATTVRKTTLEDEEDAMKSVEQEFDNPDRLISYRTMIARSPVRFMPFESRQLIVHKRHFILFKHHIRASESRSERSFLTLECLGRSLAPIRTLLEDAQTHSLEKTASTTNVFRAEGSWQLIMSRPFRDIDTVILDKKKKRTLLCDINEYLHPRTRRWYSNHGIPYRRGYLFSGAPGTGKTSLTAALAGVFGLDIYVLSLLDSHLTETTLVRLLGNVPSRCILLLEDVDAAGLGKRPDSPLSKERDKDKEKESTDGDKDPTTEESTKKPTSNGISLSGLLNAIDGVSSNEGRILIMTTNNPEELDKALIRPGRVDMHVTFELPTKIQMQELFLSMYKDHDSKMEAELTEAKNGKASSGIAPPSRDAANPASASPLSTEELRALSQTFADSLPQNRLTLAALQGFLLTYKRDPHKAAENAKVWAEETLKG